MQNVVQRGAGDVAADVVLQPLPKSGLYRKTFFRHPIQAVEAEAKHLHEIEQQGESGETPFIAILGLINMVYGALCAMAQKDFKSLVAYSSISHMGYVLLGLAALTEMAVAGRGKPVEFPDFTRGGWKTRRPLRARPAMWRRSPSSVVNGSMRRSDPAER